MKHTIFNVETPNRTIEPVSVQVRGDRMWVKLQDLGDILDTSVDDWFKETELGRQILTKPTWKGESYEKTHNSIWAIQALALEFVRSCEDSEWLADKLLEIFNYEHPQIIDFSGPASAYVRMIGEKEAEEMRDFLKSALELRTFKLEPLLTSNLPGFEAKRFWGIDLSSEAMQALEEQVLKGPNGAIGTIYDGLASDIQKIRCYELSPIASIARVLIDSTPDIRAKLIEAKVNGDARPIAVIKADLEEVQKLDSETERKPDTDTEPEGVEAIDRALRAINEASRTLDLVTGVARKAFNAFLADTDEPNEHYGVREADRALSAEEIGAEMGLNEETVNVLLTHYDFQRRESLSQTYPNLCSYHPTSEGVAYCKQLLVIRCAASPGFYYRPLWDRSLIEALQAKIDA